MPDNKTPSDIVEVILAIDLNPNDPEEPINVGDVKVSPKGGDDASDNKLVDQLLAAIAKIDPDVAYLVKENEGNPRAAVRAIEKHAEKAPEDAQDEADSFDKAQRAQKPDRSPEERYGQPKRKERPEIEDKGDFEPRPKKPRFDDERDDEAPEQKKKFGGFQGASDRAFGKKKFDDEDEEL